MPEKNETGALLRRHAALYPGMEAQDYIKLLYQNEWGGEHLVTDAAEFELRLAREMAIPGLFTASPPAPTPIGGGLCRAHLAAMESGPLPATLARLCLRAAARHRGDGESFSRKLGALRQMLEEGALPLPREDAARVDEYIRQGCAAVHHSGRFAALYRPHYRLLGEAEALYLPVFAAVDRALGQKAHVLLCIDGMCASGKSSLARLLAETYGCGLVQADDFFLQPHQRTKERLAQPGGNIDYERMAETAAMAADDRAFTYEAFDCQTMRMGHSRAVPAGPLTVVEGAYCLHPRVAAKADVRVFLRLDARRQMSRIEKRNGPEMARRFAEEWIPMENRYFAAFSVREGCDIVVDTTPLG